MNVSEQLPSLGRRALRLGGYLQNLAHSTTWPPHTHLFLVSDSPVWVLSWEMKEVGAIAKKLGIQVAPTSHAAGVRKQSIFYASHYILMEPERLGDTNRIGFAYFHGKPCPEEPAFSACYDCLVSHHERIDRIQVSNSAMLDLVLSSGIAPGKVRLIPIGVNLSFFQRQTPESRRTARGLFELPQNAVIVGSFQKDGVGWDGGLEPKRIKGPDVFLGVIERLKAGISELFVLLSGPARGYVKKGLERLGVPYRHLYLRDYPEVGRLFQALDLYLVASREEGGPKAVLESMASGVPLVTTRVGQATDLVRHGKNGWMVESEDVDGLAHWAQYAAEHRDSVDEVLCEAYRTAQANTYEAQTPLWRDFFEGFVRTGNQH